MYQESRIYIQYFQKYINNIPNIDRLINNLTTNPSLGHLVHAECVKRFSESNIFKITDIEVKDLNSQTDVDIELDGSINIQVWHGASYSTHRIIEGGASGGVKSDLNQDEKVINKKLKQLPNTKPGFLICYNHHLGIYILPEWENAIKDNKAIIELSDSCYGNGIQNVGKLYCSNEFKNIRLANKIASALGYEIPNW